MQHADRYTVPLIDRRFTDRCTLGLGLTCNDQLYIREDHYDVIHAYLIVTEIIAMQRYFQKIISAYLFNVLSRQECDVAARPSAHLSPQSLLLQMEFVKSEGEPEVTSAGAQMIDAENPVIVKYCAVCSMPPEFCEYGTCFDRCLPWIRENCPEVLSEEALSKAVESVSLEEGKDAGESEEKKKPRGAGAAAPKKATVLDTKVVIARIQRQKRKYVTVVGGLETVPDLKIKDAAKVLGKKFASGASINESPTGQKEVVIQGDVFLEVPQVVINEFKVSG